MAMMTVEMAQTNKAVVSNNHLLILLNVLFLFAKTYILIFLGILCKTVTEGQTLLEVVKPVNDNGDNTWLNKLRVTQCCAWGNDSWWIISFLTADELSGARAQAVMQLIHTDRR